MPPEVQHCSPPPHHYSPPLVVGLLGPGFGFVLPSCCFTTAVVVLPSWCFATAVTRLEAVDVKLSRHVCKTILEVGGFFVAQVGNFVVLFGKPGCCGCLLG